MSPGTCKNRHVSWFRECTNAVSRRIRSLLSDCCAAGAAHSSWDPLYSDVGSHHPIFREGTKGRPGLPSLRAQTSYVESLDFPTSLLVPLSSSAYEPFHPDAFHFLNTQVDVFHAGINYNVLMHLLAGLSGKVGEPQSSWRLYRGVVHGKLCR